jgi:hypothetical protein
LQSFRLNGVRYWQRWSHKGGQKYGPYWFSRAGSTSRAVFIGLELPGDVLERLEEAQRAQAAITRVERVLSPLRKLVRGEKLTTEEEEIVKRALEEA